MGSVGFSGANVGLDVGGCTPMASVPGFIGRIVDCSVWIDESGCDGLLGWPVYVQRWKMNKENN